MSERETKIKYLYLDGKDGSALISVDDITSVDYLKMDYMKESPRFSLNMIDGTSYNIYVNKENVEFVRVAIQRAYMQMKVAPEQNFLVQELYEEFGFVCYSLTLNSDYLVQVEHI